MKNVLILHRRAASGRRDFRRHCSGSLPDGRYRCRRRRGAGADIAARGMLHLRLRGHARLQLNRIVVVVKHLC